MLAHAEKLLGNRCPREHVAILLLDVKGFALLNDSFGHDVGDALLAAMSDRLRAAVRDDDFVTRFGGDEFGVACGRLKHPEEATYLARRLLAALERPIRVGEQPLFLGASAGIAVTRSSATTAVDLLRDSDTALYRAKRSDVGALLFDPSMRERSRALLELASDLRDSLAQRQLRVEYQPIVSLPGGAPASFEALARWRHPRRGGVPPADFIPVAEQTGLIGQIGEWVLREALTAANRWEQVVGVGAPRVAVNVSAPQLSDPDFVYTVTRALGEVGVDPIRLILEVTESAVMEDVAAASETLRVLSGLGVEIALDDFGSGLSSLSQLRDLCWVDTLKIDKTFASGVGARVADTAIVRSVVDLGHALEMSVVIEGVETESQALALTELGCDRAQGWHFGRSMRPAAVDAMLAAGPDLAPLES